MNLGFLFKCRCADIYWGRNPMLGVMW